MDERKDEDIMLQFLAGDKEAVSMIFDRYRNPILNFCLRILGNRADAEDVVGTVFLNLFTQKYTYSPGPAKFSTWLFTIARNSCMDRIRKKKRFISLWFTKEDGTTEAWDVEDSRDLSREELAKKDTQTQVRLAITKLPLEQREALVLREYHAQSYEEIAKILDCSLEKVKILIFRGREQLRQELSSLIQEGQQ